MIGGIACVAATAGTAASLCLGATIAGLGISLADSVAESDGGIFIDLGIELITSALTRYFPADEVAQMVIQGSGAVLDFMLNLGEMLCWDGY